MKLLKEQGEQENECEKQPEGWDLFHREIAPLQEWIGRYLIMAFSYLPRIMAASNILATTGGQLPFVGDD
jgi:hypothetical protein